MSRKRAAPSFFEDDDSENIKPDFSSFKKSKTSDGITKPLQFSTILTSPSKPSPSITATPTIPSVRKALSSPKPNTSNSTPIGLSRGSPKHKRIGLLSKRRASSSPFRRVDPPSFSHSSPSLPFSIDAALKGTIPDYTPKPSIATPTPVSTPRDVTTIEESMPNSWFFEIHEDTPEQEAANLMEHSAAVLDISSDDDSETKRMNEDLERGKENIPPPDFMPSQPSARAEQSIDTMETNEPVTKEHVKLPRLRKIAQDAMDEDRFALKELPAADFYGEGLDATSYVTVDTGIERPSSLSKEFDFSSESREEEPAKEELVEPVVQEKGIQIYEDSTPTAECDSAAAVPLPEDIPALVESVPEVSAVSEVAP